MYHLTALFCKEGGERLQIVELRGVAATPAPAILDFSAALQKAYRSANSRVLPLKSGVGMGASPAMALEACPLPL